ncbi:D-amino-acid transaminase [Paenibacillus sp. GCM10023248]|uniref:D-amino-acid transaminase n=1 Tax=Bacillales TaxID=1385 RepID=UPI0023798603|nr:MULTISPECIES: D-amino-acid transaminase [Bacillales]MDD9265510.1 D-amino-acid transaminase [Paenibacillus sp. MAHUQ-63]MDR6885420.1 D-alanine transaminase [Bacillus sp. 3255]
MYFYKNEFINKQDLHVSPDDRGYYFGDGIYEVFRVYNGHLYEADAHMQRLARTASEVRIELPYPVQRIEEILTGLVARNHLIEGTVYLQVTRGEAPRAHPFPQQSEPVMLAYCTEVPRPAATIHNGIKTITFADIRWLRCDLKTLNLLPNVMAKQAALDHGVQEVILHREGTVTECSASNIMMIKDGVLYTHPANHLILHGITRAVVLRLARSIGIPVSEEAFTTEQLMLADEAFITGTTVEVTPILEVDGAAIGTGVPGPQTRRLQEEFVRTFA